MGKVKEVKDRDGVLTGWKVTVCVGRDERTYKQIWRTCIIRPDDDRITETTPKKRLKQVQNIADAWSDAEKQKYKKNLSDKKPVDKHHITMQQLIEDKWLINHVESGKKTPSTVAFYKYMASDIVEYYGTRTEVKDIDRESLESYEKYLRTAAKTKQGNKYSETSIRRHLETLRNILKYAKLNHYITEEPFSEYKINTKSDKMETVDYLTPDEAKYFLQCLESESLYWQCLIRIAITNGLRRGEICGLCWQDIDFDGMRILIRRNVTVDVKNRNVENSNEHGYHIGATKAKKQRSAYITPLIKDLLTKLRAEQEVKYNIEMPVYKRIIPEKEELYFVFCTPTTPLRPLYPTTPETWIKRFEERNNIRSVSMHDLRHTAGTLAKIAGMDLVDIQKMLGHSDLKTTAQYYLGVDEDALRRATDGIEGLLTEKKTGGKKPKHRSKKK